jgi:hypothetical protein
LQLIGLGFVVVLKLAAEKVEIEKAEVELAGVEIVAKFGVD